MDLSARSRTVAPGHPVKFFLHRNIFDYGPHYRNVADWQFDKTKPFHRKNLLAHFGCVNAIEFSKDGSLLVSGGDDRRVLLWNVDKAIVSKEEPKVMQAEHLSNVFSLDFNCHSEKIFSAGNDDQVIVHDISRGVPLDYFVHEQPVYGVSADPVNESVFCSACDDGRILIFDIRESGNEPFCLAKATSAFHSVMFHPIEPRLVVTSNSKEGVSSWDVRMPKRVFVKYGLQNSNQCCMSARFNRLGTQILVLRRRLPPILYSTDSPTHLYQFNHRGYYNSCTMKSCSFAGMNDQYVLSGSDNFDLHLWKIPTPGSDQWVNKADIVLRGHRSIVNQVRYNYTHNVIASSGVEKIVKLWSPFPLSDELGGKSPAVIVNESDRRIYTPDDYVSLIMQAGPGQGNFMSLTYENGRKTTREDSRMLAFFDALVQRDINGLSDEDSDNFPETSYTNTVYTTPETTSSENEDEDSNPPNFRSVLPADTPNTVYTTASFPVENSSTPSSVNDDDDPSGTNAVLNDSVVDENAATAEQENDEPVESPEDREMTANMITKLILKKENTRRRILKSSPTRKTSSNNNQSSETDSDSNDHSHNEGKSSSRSSRNSSSRPLKTTRAGSDNTSTLTDKSSYKKSRNEFRRKLLQARRREILSAPVYESSRNATDNQAARSSAENNYDRINELMTRSQLSQLSGSSSSSSSSDSSSSEECAPSPSQSVIKPKKKNLGAVKKSRVIRSSSSSSSSETTNDYASSSVGLKDEESDSEPTNSQSGSIKDLKRKRKPPCKLNEACKAFFKKYASSVGTSQEAEEDAAVPYKRMRQQCSESPSTESPTEITKAEVPVAFKKFSKQKDRNYRKVSSSVGLSSTSTPPDSGIDVSKEPEPCCSKSFTAVEKKTKSVSQNQKKIPKSIDDPGFEQDDSQEESD